VETVIVLPRRVLKELTVRVLDHEGPTLELTVNNEPAGTAEPAL
jgi:hypothetical protein